MVHSQMSRPTGAMVKVFAVVVAIVAVAPTVVDFFAESECQPSSWLVIT